MKPIRSISRLLLVSVLGITLATATAWADYCLGINCGAGRDGWHCHTQNTLGVECWDAEDNNCEEISGFSRSEAQSCGADGVAVGVAGAIANQIPTLGGLNTFQGQIRKTAVSRQESEQAAETETSSEETEEKAAGVVFISEMTSSLENEQWEYLGTKGDTLGINLGWQHQSEGGHLWGVSGSYQEAKPESGPTFELVNTSFNYGRALGASETWKWSVSATASDLSGAVEETFLGGGGQIYFNKYYDNGAVLSGGAIVQYQTGDEFVDVLKTVGCGIAYGFPVGQRFALDFEGFGATFLDTDLEADTFFTLGTMFSIYFTPRFSLTLGYRVLEGIDELDSDTITLGSSTRW